MQVCLQLPPRSCAMAAAVASPGTTLVAPAKSADFDYLRYQDKIKEYVVKVKSVIPASRKGAHGSSRKVPHTQVDRAIACCLLECRTVSNM